MFLSELQFIGVSRTDFKEKKTDFFTQFRVNKNPGRTGTYHPEIRII